MKNKNVVLALVALALLGVSGYLLFGRAVATPKVGEQFTFKGPCLACKQEVEGVYKISESEPFTCPVCQQRAAFQWWFCYDCQKKTIPHFVKAKGDQPAEIPPHPRCSRCNCTTVGTYMPDIMPDQVSHGDNPLPKWP